MKDRVTLPFGPIPVAGTKRVGGLIYPTTLVGAPEETMDHYNMKSGRVFTCDK